MHDSSPFSSQVAFSTHVTLELRDLNGRRYTRSWPAASHDEAVRKAAACGYEVLAVASPTEPASVPRTASARGRFPLLLFSQELLTLLEAGLNLTEAIATLLAKERQPASRNLLQQTLHALRQGHSFSEVLATHPRVFPEVYAATVRASERTGDLPRALARYISYEQQFDSLRKKLIAAAIYPTLLLCVGSFVALFLLGYVVPKFSSVYDASGRDIPWLSGLLLSVGAAIHAHWRESAFVAATILTILGLLSARPGARSFVADLVLRLPGLAERAADFRLARYFRATSLLLASGIALPRALGMVDGLLGPAQRRRSALARRNVESGLSLSAALAAAGLSSPVADSLLKVGERSGQLGTMLERTAQFHDDDFARWVDWTSRLLEPVLMMLIGLVIGAVVVLMYLPIFELAGSLQ